MRAGSSRSALGADGRRLCDRGCERRAARRPRAGRAAVAACAARHGADRVVAEKNQGGEMVRSVLRGGGRGAAGDGWSTRAAARWRGPSRWRRSTSAGGCGMSARFRRWRTSCAGWSRAAGMQGPGRSPDRADALVWALTELMLGGAGAAAVRTV